MRDLTAVARPGPPNPPGPASYPRMMALTGDSQPRLAHLIRPRLGPALALAATIAAGLSARAFLTGWWAKYLGVALWAVAAYGAITLLFPRARVRSLALAALAVSWAVELAQITPVPRTLSSWHPLLRLIFGEVFSPYDLVALAVGVVFAAAAHLALRSARPVAPVKK